MEKRKLLRSGIIRLEPEISKKKKVNIVQKKKKRKM